MYKNTFEDLGVIVHILLLLGGGVTIVCGFIASIVALTYEQGDVALVLVLATIGLLMEVIRVADSA